MFEFVRKHTKVMMFLMFLMIIPAFVLVGVDGFQNINAGGEAVATVGSQSIKQAEWDAAKVATQEATDKALTAVAQAIATRDVKHTTITQKVIRETVEVPVYRECSHAPSVFNDINAALSVSADLGELPASDAAR